MILRCRNFSSVGRRARANLITLGALVAFAACSDAEPGGVNPPIPAPTPEPQLQPAVLDCTATTSSRQVTCAPAAGGLSAGDGAWRATSGRGGLWAAGSGDAGASLILGGQGVNVTMTGTNVAYDAGTQEFTFDATVTNHIGQPLGTNDGATPHADGVRVFFHSLPMKTAGDPGAPAGPYGVASHGLATFTMADQHYYQFDGVIEDEQASGAVQFRFTGVPANIDFGFRVLVWAPVQWPDGWVAVAPSADTLDVSDEANRSVALAATVYSRVGLVQAEAVTWESSDSNIATVDASGVVTAVAAGSATITASADGRTAGTATITVVDPRVAPNAVDDGPAAGSSPGQPFHALYSVSGGRRTFTLPAPGVLANDGLGDPAAVITSFGGDSIGGAVTSYAAGTTLSPLPGDGRTTGSLRVGADGSIVFTPPDGFTGNFVFQYRLTNAVGTSDAQVTIAVGEPPEAVDDVYAPQLVGNVAINTATSTKFRVTDNDRGDALQVAVLSQTGGEVTIDPGNTFRFRPTPGFEGPAGFTYTVSNGFGTSEPATVSLTVGTPIWFVSAAAAEGGDGRFDAPFNSLQALDAVNDGTGDNPADGDLIFVYSGAYTGGLTLRPSQRLFGQLATASFNVVTGVTWPADAGPMPMMTGAAPTITTTDPGINGINLGQDNTLRGFTIGNVTGSALYGSDFGTLSIAEFGMVGTGQALNLTNGTLSGNFSRVRSTGGANNVYLSNVSTVGTTVLGTAIVDVLFGATGDALVIEGGDGSFIYPGGLGGAKGHELNISGKTGGSVTIGGVINASSGPTIRIADNSGGTTINLNGQQIVANAGTSDAVTLTNNSGAFVNFTGGNLYIKTTTGNGFTATGGGTVTVTGANNEISAAGGNALKVVNTTIGADGLTFKAVYAMGGKTGIVLDNTGNSGGLTVTGTGDSLSGGSIQSLTGTAGTTEGIGVYLNRTQDVNLRSMWIAHNQYFGIYGSEVHGLTLADLTINGLAGTDATADEATIAFTGLTGSARISSSAISGGVGDNFRVRNTTGTLDRIVFDTVTIGGNGPFVGLNGIKLEASGDAVMHVTVQNSNFASSRRELFELNASGTAVSDLQFTGNTIENVHWDIEPGSGGVRIIGGGVGSNVSLTYDIANNTFRGASGHALLVSKADGTGSMVGTISNNQIGAAATNNSGSKQGSGIAALLVGGGTHSTTITNNEVRQYNSHGILLEAGDNLRGGHGSLNAVVTGNTIANPGAGATNGFYLNAGLTSAPVDQHQICLAMTGNTLAGSGANGATDFRLQQRDGTTVRLPGYAGGNSDAAAITAFIQVNNGGAPTGSISTMAPPGGGFIGGGGCM